MINVAIINESVHQNALRVARAIGKETPLPIGVLNAPLDSDSSNWIAKLWDSAEAALNRAYREGVEAAQPMIEKLSAQLGELGTSLASRANEIRSVIMERLNAYLQAAVDGALQRVRPSINVGGGLLTLRKVTLEQKLTMTGSLKASLEELCELVAEGEITLGTEYEAAV